MPTRRLESWSLLLALPALLAHTACVGNARAAKPDLHVLDPKGNAYYPPPATILARALLAEVYETYAQRRKMVATQTSLQEIAGRQQKLRAFLQESLGETPPRTPLDPHIVGTLNRVGYRIEKVIFQSRPFHHVTANLYLPDRKPPYPGILIPCGHSDNGKAYEDYQRISILLAKNGMAALCYDPIGQGERMQMLDANGKPIIRGTLEHTMAGVGALLVGRQLATYRVWDATRALDFLASRPEIDPDRLACTGNSGGGTMTAYLMSLDDRISVAAPSCFITSEERLLETIGPQDAEQNITGMIGAGMDHADFITIHAPKPTLMTVGTRDFFDIKGSWDTFREVKLTYGRFGFGERVDLFESDEPHGFTRARRIATVRWMSRWLLKRDEPIEEPDFSIESNIALQCTSSGQIITDLRDHSVFDENSARGSELQKEREAVTSKLDLVSFRNRAKALLGISGQPVPQAKSRIVETVETEGYTLRKLLFDVEPGIILSALDFAPSIPTTESSVTLEIVPDWIQELPDDQAIGQRIRSEGRVIFFSPRGMGETTPSTPSANRSWPFGRDWKEAYIGILQGRPLLGRRVLDTLSVLNSLSADSQKNHGFKLVGIGAAGPVALHAALFDDRNTIKSVTVDRSLRSWTDIVKSGMCRDQLGNVVPNVLAFYDLPDLVARLAPLPVLIKNPLDPSGQPFESK